MFLNPYKGKFTIPREWSNNELKKVAPFFIGDVINVSGWDDRDKQGGFYKSYFKGCTNYYISNFKGTRGTTDAASITDFELDLESALREDMVNRFDVVFNHTTLEHIYDVFNAFKNLCLMSRDVVIVVVPFAQEIHTSDSFGDYWRFTPMALRRLFDQYGFEVIYESGNNSDNVSSYVISIGSRNPEKWRGKMPAFSEVKDLANWIGRPPFWLKLLIQLKAKFF